MPGFVVAMKNAFKLDSESTLDFMRELKTLTPVDRDQYFVILMQGGVVCDPPIVHPEQAA